MLVSAAIRGSWPLPFNRSGVLTPSVSYQYTTINTEMSNNDDVTTVAVTGAVMFNVGYTAMW